MKNSSTFLTLTLLDWYLFMQFKSYSSYEGVRRSHQCLYKLLTSSGKSEKYLWHKAYLAVILFLGFSWSIRCVRVKLLAEGQTPPRKIKELFYLVFLLMWAFLNISPNLEAASPKASLLLWECRLSWKFLQARHLHFGQGTKGAMWAFPQKYSPLTKCQWSWKNRNVMRCIIIEDQPPAQRILKKFIADVNTLELKGVFSDALLALEYLKSEEIELLFLDIHLPKISGIDFLKTLPNPPLLLYMQVHPQCHFIVIQWRSIKSPCFNNSKNEFPTFTAPTGPTTILTNSPHQADMPEYPHAHVIVIQCRDINFSCFNNSKNEFHTFTAPTGPTTILTNSPHQADMPEYPHAQVILIQCRDINFPALTTAKMSFPHSQLLLGQQQF